MRNFIVTTGILLMLATATTAYAAGPGTDTQNTETQTTQPQSNRWQGSGDTWRVQTQDGTGYLTNSWFEDNDGSWYMLGNDGVMFSGIITDQSTGKSYLLNTQHDGTYGRMLTVNGMYTINGKQVYLTFNQAHDGSYGAITSDLSEVRSSGVRETQLASIPSDSSETQPTKPNATGSYDEFIEELKKKPFEQWTQEEKDRAIEGNDGSTVGHPDDIDMDAARRLAESMRY